MFVKISIPCVENLTLLLLFTPTFTIFWHRRKRLIECGRLTIEVDLDFTRLILLRFPRATEPLQHRLKSLNFLCMLLFVDIGFWSAYQLLSFEILPLTKLAFVRFLVTNIVAITWFGSIVAGLFKNLVFPTRLVLKLLFHALNSSSFIYLDLSLGN